VAKDDDGDAVDSDKGSSYGGKDTGISALVKPPGVSDKKMIQAAMQKRRLHSSQSPIIVYKKHLIRV
jgi:hypothetical protein